MSEPSQHLHPGLSLFRPPYRGLTPLLERSAKRGADAPGGSALVWQLALGDWGSAYRRVRDRRPGLALIMILPPADRMESVPTVLEATAKCRPHSVLPHHDEPDPEELRVVLRRAPEDLPVEMVDYLSWRGIQVDLDTRRLIRKTIELSGELRTVSGLARSLYLSRRALGRRFRKRGLPVPSHLLHFSRVLRACLALQTSPRPLVEIAFHLGYPDAFSLSNQMLRLTGLRPSEVRDRLGWEWIVEAWLQAEAADGKLEALQDRNPRPRSRSEVAGSRIPDADPGASNWRGPTARRRTPAP